MWTQSLHSPSRNTNLALHGELRDRLQRIDRDRERFERRRRPFAKRVVGTDQIGYYLRFFDAYRDNLPAFHRSCGSHRVIGIKRKCAVAAPQIGRAHAGQGVPICLDGREIRRHAKNRVGHGIVVQCLPERFSLAELLGGAASEWNHPAAQVNSMLRRLHSRSREIRLQRPGIAVDEIKDAVPARRSCR